MSKKQFIAALAVSMVALGQAGVSADGAVISPVDPSTPVVTTPESKEPNPTQPITNEEVPVTPDVPVTPEVPEVPVVPETPSTPGVPSEEVPVAPTTPEVPAEVETKPTEEKPNNEVKPSEEVAPIKPVQPSPGTPVAPTSPSTSQSSKVNPKPSTISSKVEVAATTGGEAKSSEKETVVVKKANTDAKKATNDSKELTELPSTGTEESMFSIFGGVLAATAAYFLKKRSI